MWEVEKRKIPAAAKQISVAVAAGAVLNCPFLRLKEEMCLPHSARIPFNTPACHRTGLGHANLMEGRLGGKRFCRSLVCS